jgi:hypothetical protein
MVMTIRVESTIHASTTTSGVGSQAKCRSAVLHGRPLRSETSRAVRWLRPRPVPKVPPTRLDTRLLVASDDLTSITIYSSAISPLVPLRATTTRAIFTR